MNAPTLRFGSPASRRAVWLAAILVPFACLLLFLSVAEGVRPAPLAFAAALGLSAMALVWREQCANRRTLTFDPDRKVLIESMPGVFGHRERCFPVEQFATVISFRSQHQPFPWRIELRTSNQPQGLLVSTFIPSDLPGTQGDLNEHGEPLWAHQMREQVARSLNIPDSRLIPEEVPFWRFARQGRLKQMHPRPAS